MSSQLIKYQLVIIFAALLVLPGCFIAKNSKVQKAYQNITARFNAYFHAREILKETEQNLHQAHKDDYTNILLLFRYADEAAGQRTSPQMDKVIEKATKIIQKKDRSNWVDDSYFLIGKANFYKRDYFTAIEVFQFINERYPRTDLAYLSMVWIARTYLQMERYSDAQAVLTDLKSDRRFPENLKNELLLTDAQHAIFNRNYPLAIENIEKILPEVRQKQQKLRYNFILGQLYQQTGNRQKAQQYYDAVVTRQTPYEMLFFAKINLATDFANSSKDERRQIKENLLRLLRDDKNIQFYDQIYHSLAELELKDNNVDQAIEYFRFSLRTSKDQQRKAHTYLALADLHFNNAHYAISKNYYDSAMFSLSKNYPEYDLLLARKNVLDELIPHLIIINREDSLLKLAALPKAELDRKIKQIAEADKKAQETQQVSYQNDFFDDSPFGNSLASESVFNQPGQGTGGAWYFYNPSMVGLGKSEFTRRWGNRPLADNWRRSSAANNFLVQDNDPGEDNSIRENAGDQNNNNRSRNDDRNNDLQKYYANIPNTPELKEAAEERLINAYYNAGNIYFEKMEDLKEASETYETLLKKFPQNHHIQPVYYNLHKVYDAKGNKAKADYYKNLLIDRYPESEYALILKDPELFRQMVLTAKVNPLLEKHYQITFEAFQNNNCKEVLIRTAAANREFTDNYRKSNYEYLSIICSGRNNENYNLLDTLNEFVLRYEGHDIVAHAQNVINYLSAGSTTENIAEKETKNSILDEYLKNNEGPYYYMMVFSRQQATSQNARKAYSDFNSQYFRLDNLSIANPLLTSNQQIILVQEFTDNNKALSYLRAVDLNKEWFMQRNIAEMDHFIISAKNFNLFMENKDIESYREFYSRNFK